MPTKFDFSGRVAVVTGGASGFGRAICERLSRDGATVAAWDRNGEAATRTADALGGKAKGVAVDITDYEAVERARDATVSEFGKIDILVNSAGIAGANATLWDYPLDEWNHVQNVNLNGTFHCCKAIVPGMIAGNYGRIANIASIGGKEGNPNASAYAASKAAVIGLTKSLGKELATYNISVNAIAPAVAMTPILGEVTQEFVDYMLSKIPRGRAVLVEEVADMIAFMVSDECSFTTAFTFDISGGRATY